MTLAEDLSDASDPLDGTEDFRLSVRSTTSASLLKLTIRVDMFRTIVPALCNVDPAALGESDLRIEPEVRVPSLEAVPNSAIARSSPSLDPRVGVKCVENLTLRDRLLRFSDRPVGVDGVGTPAMGWRYRESANGVRSFEEVEGVK